MSGRHSARRRAARRPHVRRVDRAYRAYRAHVADRAYLAERADVADRRSAFLATTASLAVIVAAFGMLGLMALGTAA